MPLPPTRLPWSPSAIPALLLVPAFAAALPGPPAAGADPFADEIVLYQPGEDGNPAYVDPFTTLGSPERFTGEGVFPGVVSPFNPAFGVDELVSLGKGGVIVVRFDEPVTDDPRNPFGIDLLVFGNAGFIDRRFPDGIVGGFFGDDGGVIEVSEDGDTWVAVEGARADGMFPTAGYLDAGPYDPEPGTAPTSFTRPVDPALTMTDFLDLTHAEVLTLYAGAGGGAGIDLDGTGLDAISFVRVTNPPAAEADVEVEAFADVAPHVTGDVDGDGLVGFEDLLALLASWGACPEPPLVCPADLDADGDVDFEDLLVLLANWS